MKKLIILIVVFVLTGCEIYYVNKKELTLAGKYVVTALDVTYDDQSVGKDSLYQLGSTYLAKGDLPDPFDSIRINRFYIHLNYATIRMNLLGTDNFGRDIWEYGTSPNEIFYRVFGTTGFFSGYLQFDYFTKDKTHQTMTFIIEDDGIENLQLRSSGIWLFGNQKKVITLYLTRIGP